MKASRRVAGLLRRAAAVAVAGAVLTVGLAACSSATSLSSDSGSKATASDIAAALQKKSTITVWSWAPQDKDVATAFEKKYPNVHVNLVNAGTSTGEYTKLQNAVKAGSGAPDVALVEFHAIPQFALGGALANLSKLGLDDQKSEFASALIGSDTVNGQLVGLPTGTGPMALFYNKAVFDKYGITVPSTWDEYVADAKKLHAANPNEYMTSDTGDPGFTTSMIWDAGGKPFRISGKNNITIDLQDAGSKKFANEWNPLIEGGDLSTVAGWSNEWYQALANGSIASLVIGGWMPSDLESGVPSGTGDWRVAPLPTWTAGAPAASVENGGGGLSVMQQSKNKLAAAGFVKFYATGQGAKIYVDEGGFPALNSLLVSPSFTDRPSAYFGGQKINQVLAAAAQSIIPGWNFLPYQVYANSVFHDSVGTVYANKSNLNTGLKAWQQSLVSYGKREGFNVNSK